MGLYCPKGGECKSSTRGVKQAAGTLGTMGCDSAALEFQKNGEGEGAEVRVT